MDLQVHRLNAQMLCQFKIENARDEGGLLHIFYINEIVNALRKHMKSYLGPYGMRVEIKGSMILEWTGRLRQGVGNKEFRMTTEFCLKKDNLLEAKINEKGTSTM